MPTNFNPRRHSFDLRLSQDIAARMEKEAIEAEKAIKDKVESVTKPETIPIPGPFNSKTIPLPDKPGPTPSPGAAAAGGGGSSFIGPVQPGTSNIPLPRTECFQKIGPNDPLVFKVRTCTPPCAALRVLSVIIVLRTCTCT